MNKEGYKMDEILVIKVNSEPGYFKYFKLFEKHLLNLLFKFHFKFVILKGEKFSEIID